MHRQTDRHRQTDTDKRESERERENGRQCQKHTGIYRYINESSSA